MENNQIIIYQTADGRNLVDVKLTDNSIWLNQHQLAELFETDRTSLVKHIKNIYKTEELLENSTCANFAQVQTEGRRTINRDIVHCNLDMIISLGYRVNSKRGTHFRIWANSVLKEFLIQGYAINEHKLKEQTKQLKQLKQTIDLLGQCDQKQGTYR